MKAISFSLLLAVVAAAMVYDSARASAEIEASAVADAIVRHYCVDEYWESRAPPKPARTLPLAVRIEGDTAYAWVEALNTYRGGLRFADFYFIETLGGRSAVTQSDAYRIDVIESRPDFQERHDLVFAANVQMLELQVPGDCSQHFEGDTPLKARMLGAIERAMIDKLTEFNLYGPIHYSKRTRIVIGNFNRDSSGTFVLVPESGEIFEITMHDTFDPLDDFLLDKGAYPMSQVLSPTQVRRYRPKILAVGIEREIELGN